MFNRKAKIANLPPFPPLSCPQESHPCSSNPFKRRASRSPSKEVDDEETLSKKPKESDEAPLETDGACSPDKKKRAVASFASPVPKVAFKSFVSPKKKGANPYYIHFQYVNAKLVNYYFSRAKFGTNKTYANHLMRQAVLKGDAWVVDLNVSEDEFFLHVEGVIQKHFPGSKYNKRLFLLNGAYDFKSFEEFAAFVRPLAIHIVKELNKRLNVDSQLSVPSSNEDLIDMLDDGVFADVAGNDAACEKLIAVLGDEYSPEDFEDNKELIYCFFKPGSIPNHIGKLLGCSASDMQEEAIYNS